MTVITKQRSQTIEEGVKNLCTKYCCKSLNEQSSGVQERINPFYVNSYGENSFGLRTFRFTNDLQERIKFVNRGLTVQGGSNMTGTDLYVNKPHCATAVRP